MWLLRLALAVLALAAAPAHADWREASSEHFVIYADSSESWLRGFAERLERYDGALRALRDLKTPPGASSNRVTIYVVPSADAVRKLCGAHCAMVAGFYVPRAGGSVAYTPRMTDSGNDVFNADVVLFHEYAHHWMLANYPAAYPRWFVEGFAEFNSTARIESDGAVQLGRAAQHRAFGLLRQAPVAIETLLDDSKVRMTPEQNTIFYGRAWLLTHMLAFEPSRQGQLSAYLKAVNDGKPSLEAGRSAFGDLKVLQQDMDRYLARSRLSALTLQPAAIVVVPIVLRALTAGEVATMPVRMRSDRGVSRAAATALLPEARKRTAAFPNDAAAQVVLAEAEYDAGNDALSEAAADRAIAADPKNREALLYKGRAQLRIAAKARATDPAVWRTARSWLVKANRLDPDAAEPLMLYYTSFLMAREKPTTSAVDGLFHAFELSPHAAGLRMLAVRQLLIEDKPQEARAVLLPLAYDPHASADNFARRLVGLIDAGTAGPAIVAQVDKGREDATPDKAGTGRDGDAPSKPDPKDGTKGKDQSSSSS